MKHRDRRDRLGARYGLRDNRSSLLPEAVSAAARDVLLLGCLRRTVNVDTDVEVFLKKTRRLLLMTCASGLPVPIHHWPLVEAIAEQSFNNDYVMVEDAEECRAVAATEASLLQNPYDGEELVNLAFVIGMYRPLAKSPLANRLAAISMSSITRTFRRGLKRLVHEPLEEARLSATIASFGGIGSGVSRAVRGQYEDHPYPRWFTLRRPRENAIDGSRRDDVLVAGCGSGQHPLAFASRYPNCRIVAIDLSLASLAHATRMAAKLGITNVTFLHGNLLEIRQLGQTFHHIECVGVLHHLREPREGWAALTDVLLPGGTMHIRLSSQVARLHVEFLRREIAANSIPATSNAMRTFRDAVLNGDRYRAFRPFLQVQDSFTLGGFRDYLFHTQEARYTVDEIARLIAGHHLTFLRFDPLTLTADYGEQHPDNPGWTSLDRWRQFEKHYAGTNLLFSFWVKKAVC